MEIHVTDVGLKVALLKVSLITVTITAGYCEWRTFNIFIIYVWRQAVFHPVGLYLWSASQQEVSAKWSKWLDWKDNVT